LALAKIALFVGIDDYPTAPLAGCVNDATRMSNLLSRHHDDSPNFECRKLLSSQETIDRAKLRRAVEDLFKRPADVALFFFAGHGTVNNLGGFLVTQDARQYDEGMGMTDVLAMANASPARERVIVLDCCHSGALGQLPAISNDAAMLKEGVSILSASRASEASVEAAGGGLFTSLVYDALNGGAADVCGKVTVASVYAYVDEVLGGWDQRPLFKSHVSKLVSLRTCKPAVEPGILRVLPKYFRSPDMELPLDPSYEPESEPRNPEHEKIFKHLQTLRDARLVVPVGEAHLYYAAMNSKACKLTELGTYYWHLANSGKI
jgi:caspase domain-containing protein